jgi:hypothetical protein
MLSMKTTTKLSSSSINTLFMRFMKKAGLEEILGPLKLVEEVIDPREWILVFDCNFIQGSVINTHPHTSILFGDEKDWCSPRRRARTNVPFLLELCDLEF